MTTGTVISLRKYMEERLAGARRKTAQSEARPHVDRLWELMDRNISIALWKKEI